MKLTIYDKSNSGHEPCGKRAIRVYENGVLSIFPQTARMCGLKSGDKIVVACNSDNPKEWFFGKTDHESGFDLHPYKGSLKFNNKVIATAILSSLKIDRSAAFLISKTPETIDGIDYYRLITSNPIKREAVKIPIKKQL